MPSLVWFLATREREANAHMHAREKCLSDNIKWMRTMNTTFESSHPVLPISSQTARTRSLTKWGCNPQFVELQFSQLSRARQKLHPQQWIQEVAWLEFYWMKNSTNRWSTVWWSRITTQHYDYEPTIRRATNNELRRTTRLEIDQHQPLNSDICTCFVFGCQDKVDSAILKKVRLHRLSISGCTEKWKY